MNNKPGYLKKILEKGGKGKVYFLVWQVIITGTNALIGFIILRGLTKTEYAVYTIVFSLLAIFSNITNIGITPAMNGIGGKIWQKPKELQALLNTALRLRHQLGWWFAGPFIVYCVWQFAETGLDWFSLSILILLLLIAGWVQLQFALYSIILQLNKAVNDLQRNELWVVLLKLSGICIILFTGAPLIVLVGWIGLCLFINLRANQYLARRFLHPHTETRPQFEQQINSIIRSNFLRTVYWSLEGQISILLCTIFATTNNIAEIGALGRLAVYFTVFQAFILNYSLPRLAKLQNKYAILAQAKQIFAATIAVILPILFWALLHPDSLLWVLGSNYSDLKPFLLSFLMVSALGQLAAISYQICAAKAWIELNRYYVQLAIPIQIGLIWLLDLSNLGAVILFVGIINGFFLLYNIIMFYISYLRYQPDTISE